MIDLAVLVVSIAAVDSLNPTTIVLALYIATGPHPVRGVVGFAAGFFVVNLIGGMVILALGHRVARLVPRPSSEVEHWVELAVGVAAVIAAGFLWRRRHSIGAGFAKVERVGHRFAPLTGATVAAVELPTAFPYFAVIAALAASRQPVAVDVALLVVFNVIFVAPLVAIAIVRAFAGGRADETLTRVRSLVLRYAGSVVAVLVLVLGVALIALGAAGLRRSF